MSDLQSFLHMGGYAMYVWPAYAITFVLLIANIIAARLSYKAQLRKAHQQQRAGRGRGRS